MKNEFWVVFKIMCAEKTTKHHPNSNNNPPPPNKYFALYTGKKILFFLLQIWQNNEFFLESCFLLNIIFIVRDISKHMDNTEVEAQM